MGLSNDVIINEQKTTHIYDKTFSSHHFVVQITFAKYAFLL